MKMIDRSALPHLVLVCCLLLVALVPLFTTNSYLLRFAVTVAMFAALGQAWNIVGGLGNQVSLGHAAYFGLGAYCSAVLFQQYAISPWIGMIVGGFLSAGLAALISFPTFRLRGPYFALATLAVAEVLQVFSVYARGLTGGAMGIYLPFRAESWVNLQFRGMAPYLYIMLGLLCLITLTFVFVERSSLGMRLKALRHDEEAASSVGVNVFASKFYASLISAFCTSLVGSVYAHFQGFIDPASVFGLVSISVMMAMVAIVGGLGHAAGPVIGAAILIPAQELMQRVGGANPGYSTFFFGAILIFVILLTPNGIVSLLSWRRKRTTELPLRLSDEETAR